MVCARTRGVVGECMFTIVTMAYEVDEWRIASPSRVILKSLTVFSAGRCAEYGTHPTT
jgi:hypothetical protein